MAPVVNVASIQASVASSVNHTLSRRESPKIGGSVGGFIALVVCLAVIIIVSCSAVAYLLLTSPPPPEHDTHRQRNRYPLQSVTSGTPFNFKPTLSPPSRFARLTSIFGPSRASGNNEDPKSKGVGRGWIRTSSGDDWDSDSGDERRFTPRTSRNLDVLDQNRQMTYSPRSATPSSPLASPPLQTESTSSVRFSLPPTSVPLYKEVICPSPQSTVPTHFSSLPSSGAGSPAPLRTATPEAIAEGSNVDITFGGTDDGRRHFSVNSGVSIRTFEGGTKFIESL